MKEKRSRAAPMVDLSQPWALGPENCKDQLAEFERDFDDLTEAMRTRHASKDELTAWAELRERVWTCQLYVDAQQARRRRKSKPESIGERNASWRREYKAAGRDNKTAFAKDIAKRDGVGVELVRTALKNVR